MSKCCSYWYFLISHREIPEDVLILHEIHCERYLYLCVSCNKPIAKKEKLAHDKALHQTAKCPYCSLETEEKLLSGHKLICLHRPKPCLFCGAVMELHHLINHEDTCGNRTDSCEICGKFVVLKHFPEHLMTCIEIENLSPQAEKRKPEALNPAKKRLKKLHK